MVAMQDLGRALRYSNAVMKSQNQLSDRHRIVAKVPGIDGMMREQTFLTPVGAYTFARFTNSPRGKQLYNWLRRTFPKVRNENVEEVDVEE